MSIVWKSTKSIEIFYSYAQEDEAFQDILEKHLRILQRQGYIGNWNKRMISAGQEWASEIDKHLDNAQIILLLVSPDYLASDYCYNTELQRALEKLEGGNVRVIPILLRPVYWEDTPFSKLQPLPKDGMPVTKWSDRDEAFANITQGIVNAVKDMLSQQIIQTNDDKSLADKNKEPLIQKNLSTSKGKDIITYHAGLNPPSSHQKGDQHHFQGQLADEATIMVIRRHFLVPIRSVLPFLGSLLLLLCFFIYATYSHMLYFPQYIIALISLSISFLATTIKIYYELAKWWLKFDIITNKRIIDFYGIFKSRHRIISFEKILQISVNVKSSASSAIEYGDICFYLIDGIFIMKNISYPRAVKDAVLYNLSHFRKQKAKKEKNG